MRPPGSDRNLLFGIVALQLDFITSEQLLAAFHTWIQRKQDTLGQILVEQGALQPVRRDLLESLVDEYVRQHQGNPLQSLQALSHGDSTELARQKLESIPDAELQASIANLGVAQNNSTQSVHSERQPDSSTLSYVVGESSSEGSRFRILRPHARGGLGQVYVARDEELGRNVALKEIRPESAANPLFRSRFLLEAEINGNLEHPGIVPVYGLGSHPDGRPFYAMRFIQGDSLKEALDRFHGQVDRSRRKFDSMEFRGLVRRLIDVCEAIAYAHARGVLHRDLKPANIMLGRYGETLIIDWGLAKPTGRPESSAGLPDPHDAVLPRSGDSSLETVTGQALGTPAFMSPEQAQGRLDDLGPATDIYGLGAILHVLLTGRPPHVADTPEELLRLAAGGPDSSPRHLDRKIPAPLDAICAKALASRPQDRYPSARALADDLERWLADESVSARRDPLAVRFARWIRRHRTAAVSLAVSGLVGLLALTVLYRREAGIADLLRQANAREIAAREQADRRLDLALNAIEDYHTGVSAELLRKRTDLAPLRKQLLEGPARFYEQLASELEASKQKDSRSQELLASSQYGYANILTELGDFDRAITQYESARSKRLQQLREHPASLKCQLALASISSDLGLALTYRDQTSPRAIELVQEAISLLTDASQRHPEKPEVFRLLGQAWNNRMLAEGTFSNQPDQRLFLEQSIRAYERLRELDPNDSLGLFGVANARNNLGFLLFNQDQSSEAVVVLRRALEDLASYEKNSPLDLKLLDLQTDLRGNLAVALSSLGKMQEAISIIESIILSYRDLQKLAPNDPEYQISLAFAHDNLGLLYLDEKAPMKALEQNQMAVAVAERLVAQFPDVPSYRARLANFLDTLGLTLTQLNRLTEAESTLRRALALFTEASALMPADVEMRGRLGACHDNLAIVLRGLGRVDQAIATHREAIAIQAELIRSHPNTPPLYYWISNHFTHLVESLVAAHRIGEALVAIDAARGYIRPGLSEGTTQYNLACSIGCLLPFLPEAQNSSLSREAIDRLTRAIAVDPTIPGLLPFVSDLDSLRADPRFQQLIDPTLLDLCFPPFPFTEDLPPNP